jgi:hypothetical protein
MPTIERSQVKTVNCTFSAADLNSRTMLYIDFIPDAINLKHFTLISNNSTTPQNYTLIGSLFGNNDIISVALQDTNVNMINTNCDIIYVPYSKQP